MARIGWKGPLAALTAAMCLVATPALADGRFGVTTTGGVSLRQAPSSAAAKSGSYPADTWMTVASESGGWYAVTAPDGVSGYVGRDQFAEAVANVVNVGLVSGLKETAYVNLRQQPHYQAEVLATYHNGAPCLLLSHTNGWYHVRMEGREGYLREEYVTPRRMAWSEDAATVVARGGATVELREGPGEQYAVKGSYPSGQYVMALRRGSGWWYVSVEGQTGFMDASCLREGILSLAELEQASWVELTGAYAVVSNPSPTQLLNLRESPSTVSTVLGQYRSGTRLTLLNQGLEWCRVMTDAGLVGYMMTDYLTLEGVPEVPVLTVDHPDGTFVNLRSMPSTVLGAVLLQVPHGAQVEVLVPGSEWLKVRYGDATGYMVAWFLAE